MKTKLVTTAIAAALMLVSGTANAALIAGWDFSQYFGSGELFVSQPGNEGYSDVLGANYSNLLPSPGAGPTAETRGTLFFNGSFGSTDVVADSATAQLTPASGSLAANANAPFAAGGYVPFGAYTTLAAAGQGFQEDLSLQIQNTVTFVFAAYLDATPGTVNDWALSFGGRTLSGTQLLSFEFSSNGSAFIPLGTQTLTTADDPLTPFIVTAPGAAGTDQAFFRVTVANLTGSGARLDNVAINGTVVAPEPATAVLFGVVLASFALIGRRRA